MLELEVLDVGTGGLADHVQLALERILHDGVRAATDEDLADHRLLLAHGRRHGHVAVGGHIAPAQQHLAFGLDGALHLLFAGQAAGVFLGQEDHAHAVFAHGRQLHALLRHLVTVQRIGHLDQDAGAVPHQLVGTHGAAMVEVFQDLERLGDDGMALLAADVGHEANAARIMLVGCAVQAVLFQMVFFCRRAHTKYPVQRVEGWCIP